MKISELIDRLKEENADDQVECVVVAADGGIISVDVDSHAKSIKEIVKMFGSQ